MPVKYQRRKRKQTISVFKGINQGINTAMSRVSSKNSSLFLQFKDTRNVTLDDYPVIRTRDGRIISSKRNVMQSNNIISNLLACDRGLIRLENNGKLYFGDVHSYGFFSEEGRDSTLKRTLIQFGNSIVVMPDKVVVTPEFTQTGMKFSEYEMENRFYSESGEGVAENLPSVMKVPMNVSVEVTGYIRQSFAIKLTDKSEQINDDEHGQNKELFTNLTLGTLLEDTGTVPSTLYMVTDILQGEDYKEYFNERLVICTQIYNTYTKIQRSGVGEGFSADDWVRVSDMAGDCESLNSSQKILECGEDYLILNCDISKSVEYTGSMKVERVVPAEMDFIICCDNRLWGCSSKNNRIYACRLGDPKNWESYGDGISTDSYWVDVSTEGDFTGVTVSGGAVYFFKENCLHKIIGTKPRNYTVTTYKDLGIQKGSHDSAVWIKDRLFYHSAVGVCVYSPGGEPAIISDDAFGDNSYCDAVGGKHMNKYYLSLKNVSTGEYELYVFDTDISCWIKEDTERFSSTVTYNNLMYYVNDITGYLGCVEKESDNLLRKSYEEFKVNIPSNSIGEITDMFGDVQVQGIETVLGDVDGDGVVTYNDCRELQALLVSAELKEADTDKDGTITGEDIEVLLQSGKNELVRKLMAADVKKDGKVDIKDTTLLQKWVDEPELYEEEPLEFLLESGDLYDSVPEKKYIQKIELMIELTGGSEMEVAVMKNRGVWEKVKTLRSSRKLTVTVPLHPGRCDYFRIRFKGRGKFILYNLTLTTEGG